MRLMHSERYYLNPRIDEYPGEKPVPMPVHQPVIPKEQQAWIAKMEGEIEELERTHDNHPVRKSNLRWLINEIKSGCSTLYIEKYYKKIWGLSN